MEGAAAFWIDVPTHKTMMNAISIETRFMKQIPFRAWKLIFILVEHFRTYDTYTIT